MSKMDLYNGDCLEVMKNIADKSVDMILCDLPYATTAHKWDKFIPCEKLWEQYKRIIKEDGIIALFATQPFTSLLVCSNLEMYRYNWIWEKDTPNGFLNTNYCPLKKTEDICVFSSSKIGSQAKNPIRYFPQGLIEVNKTKRNNPKSKFRESAGYGTKNNVLNSDKEYLTKYKGYPSNILTFSRDKGSLHPTQKPVALLEYLIKTYTKDNENVLDNCMGSGSTGVACMYTNRNFIGIELDKNYFEIAKKRIEECVKE
jgi:site-specific DNA-methyltransferase (adenine-specific)